MAKKKHAEHVNHERWLVSYADFITLMFAFFVVMFSSSQVDQRKVGKLSRSIQGAFFEINIMPSKGSKKPLMDVGQFPGDTMATLERLIKGPKDPKAKAITAQEMGALKEALAEQLSGQLDSKKISIRVDSRGLTISLAEGAFFQSGSDIITEESKATVDEIAKTITSLKNELRIEGHTDDRPIKTKRFPSNWELSTARATQVMTYLADKYKFPASQVAIAGYASNRPLASNDTPEGRATNRRVDIVVLSAESMKKEDPMESVPKAAESQTPTEPTSETHTSDPAPQHEPKKEPNSH